MANSRDTKWYPSPDYPFFLFDPEGDGMTYFRTREDRDAAAHDAIQGYLDDGWSEEVTRVVAGDVTHHTVARGVEFCPLQHEFDSQDEYYDALGDFGGSEFDWKGRYELAPLHDPGESTTRPAKPSEEGQPC